METPYLQYFIGLLGYQTEVPFVPSLFIEFRKRLTDDFPGEINEMILAYYTSEDPSSGGGNGQVTIETDTIEDSDNGTLISDAACAP